MTRALRPNFCDKVKKKGKLRRGVEIAIRRREFLQSTTSEAGAESSVARIEKILSLELAERRIDRIRTWPFDTEIIGTLTAIFLSVVATLLAFLLTTFLNL